MSNVQGWRPVGIDEVLGSAEGRFFGSGYRRVQHVLCGGLSSLTEFQGDARVGYPEDWSLTSDGTPRTPHLSTIDGVVLPLQAISPSWGVAAGDYVSEVRLKAGSRPWLQLDHVPVAVSSSGGDGTERFERVFSARVGNIRASVTVRNAEDSPRSRAEPTPAESSVHTKLYRQTAMQTVVLGFKPSSGVLRARHRAGEPPGPQAAVGSGLEDEYWPCLTAVDYLVTMGEAVQVLIGERYGAGRSGGQLWMRSMQIQLPRPPQRLPAEFSSVTEPVSESTLDRADKKIHQVETESVTSTGVRVAAKLAYVREGSPK
ncbi:AvrD family protein [Brevibacterium picturae]